MENQVFRKKSLQQLSEPEQLTDYLRVTRPAIWISLFAVIIVIAGLFIWSSFMSIESSLSGKGVVANEMMTISFADQIQAKNVEVGMNVTVGDETVPITTVGTAENGAVIAGAHVDVPDGIYDVRVAYKSTKIISFLFN